jgi:TolA-binding protein
MRRLMVAAALLASVSAAPAFAQSSPLEGRVDRLEREMRAVQRKVFPGGAGQLVEPQITPPQSTTSAPGLPASGPITDLTARVTSLESQFTQITGQIEQTQFRVRQLEEAFNAFKRSTEARIKALEDTASSIGEPAPTANGGGVLEPPPGATPARPPATRPATTGATTPARPPAANAARAAAVAAVEKPDSGDAAEDTYLYGYRLWAAKLYPEAQAQLKAVVAKYGTHRRASYAQNLLGRAYLDEGKPSLAAVAFYENYKKMPKGERAADSLYYLAQALVKLKKPAADVCQVYSELTDVYGTKLSEEMRAGVAQGRAASKCP